MNVVKQPIGVDPSEGISVRGLEQPHGGRKWPIHYDYVEPLAIVTDIATIILASVFSGISYHLQEPSGTPGGISKSLGSAVLVSALFISLMKIRGMYRPTELLVLRNQIRAVCLAWIGVFLLLAATVFALKIGNEISRGASMLFAMFGLIALIVHRSVLRDRLATGLAWRRFSGRNIVLITDAQIGDASLTQTLTGLGFCVDGHFIFPPSNADSHRREKVIAKVIEHTRGSDIEEIVIGADPSRWSELRTLVAELRVLPFPVSFVPLGSASEIFRRPFRELGNAICVELQRGPLTSFEYAAKRCIDLLIAGVALTALMPLLAIVAVAIKLDSRGPILFRQKRCGFNGRCFPIRKFRTMSVLEDGPSIVQAQFADKRVTHLGTWLRRTSIDELPQLVNVLEGSMSLVGPRPHAVAHDNQFDKIVRNYAFRRRVKPGLTGWAQVNGCRGPTPTAASIERRIKYDLWYIDNWRLRLDFAILLQTPIVILRGDNAY